MAPTLLQVMENFGDDLANTIYHVNWPAANDPFYNYNPTPVQTRRSFYGVNSVPSTCIDGTRDPVAFPYSVGGLTNYINGRLAVSSPLAIDCSGLATGGGIELSVDVTVETPQAAGNYRLFVALIEKYIYYPGGTYQDHHNVFRWFNNNATSPHGEAIDLTASGTQHFDYTFPFSPSYQDDQLAMSVWVQDMSNRAVLQAGKATLVRPYVVDMVMTSPHTQIAGSGEPVSFAAEVSNLGAWDDTYDVTVSGVPTGWTYSYTTPAGTFSGPSTLTLTAGNTAPITLDVDSQGNAGSATITVQAVSQGDPTRIASVTVQKLNGVQVLLVDDDGGAGREVTMGATLDAIGVSWGTWDLGWGELTTTDLQTAATIVVWMAGDAVPSLTPNDRTALGGFLDGGGKVLMTGQEIAFDLADPFSPNFTPESITWFVTYLHALYINTYAGSLFLSGVPGDEIGDGLAFSLQPTGPNAQTTPDAVNPGLGSQTIITYDNTGGWSGGLKWTDGSTQLVFLTFGLEGILQSTVREELMQRIVEWFGVESNAVADPQASPPLVALAQNRPNPFRPSTSIGYRISTPGAVTLRVYDVHGRAVRTLVDGTQAAAEHRVDWNGIDEDGRPVASGIYFYRLEAPGTVETRRMVLTR